MTQDRLEWIISGLDVNQLTPQEEKFIEDMEFKFHRTGSLNEYQERRLEEIYKERGRVS